MSELRGDARFDVTALYVAVDAERTRRARAYSSFGAAGRRSYSWLRVGREAGISPSVLSKLEGGASAPSINTLVRLLMWLGTTDMAPFITHDPPPDHGCP